jgi:hypothetical protein
VNKPEPAKKRSFPRPVADLLQRTLGAAFARQGFASSELVTRWSEIAGAEIAAHAEPEKIQWPRPFDGQPMAAGTLWLRVEGPTALEIQHLSPIILERVNRFFGWRAVATLRLRQAPIRRRAPPPRPAPDPAATARIAAGLGDIVDDKLRDALARLGAAIKPT